MNVFEAIFANVSLARTAILFEQRQISYGELRADVLRMAQALRYLGVARGERIALLLHDSPEFIASFIAICSSGAIAVPINPALRLDEQRTILNDCTARLLLSETEFAAQLLSAPESVSQLKDVVIVARSEAAPGEEKLSDTVRFPGTSGGARTPAGLKVWPLRGLLGKVAVSEQQTIIPFPEPDADERSFILYTSGSTGDPKGAVHRQSDISYTNETYCREVLHLSDDDRLFSSSRLPFAYGLGNAFTFPLLNGCTTILCREKPAPEVVARVFAAYKPTIFFGVPVVFRMLLDAHKRQPHTLACASLRLCISAGEALPAAIGEEWERTIGVPILDGIGSTEMLHMWMSNHEGEVIYGSSGKLLAGYQARLLDPEGQPTVPGTEGNLWVKGASAALGYWHRPETTADTFVAGWVRTGDLYRQDANGFWFHMGRSDDCFKSSGKWVSPVEVEGVLLRHKGVDRAAVVEDFDQAGLPCPCAFVVATQWDGDRNELEQTLRATAREALPRFKQPRRYLIVDELPYTATGKIQRFRLRERLRLEGDTGR
jgi:benzoate-CoA ligase family protein